MKWISTEKEKSTADLANWEQTAKEKQTKQTNRMWVRFSYVMMLMMMMMVGGGYTITRVPIFDAPIIFWLNKKTKQSIHIFLMFFFLYLKSVQKKKCLAFDRIVLELHWTHVYGKHSERNKLGNVNMMEFFHAIISCCCCFWKKVKHRIEKTTKTRNKKKNKNAKKKAQNNNRSMPHSLLFIHPHDTQQHIYTCTIRIMKCT